MDEDGATTARGELIGLGGKRSETKATVTIRKMNPNESLSSSMGNKEINQLSVLHMHTATDDMRLKNESIARIIFYTIDLYGTLIASRPHTPLTSPCGRIGRYMISNT